MGPPRQPLAADEESGPPVVPPPALFSVLGGASLSLGAIGIPRLRLSRLLLIGGLVFVLAHGLYVLGWHHWERKAQSFASFFGFLPLTSSRLDDVRYRHGIAYWEEKEGSINGTHPIVSLIQRGQVLADMQERKRREVNSLRRAVKDYRETFGMEPPEGFDAWYNLAVSLNSTSAASLIPTAHTSILPFLSMPPSLLRERANETTGIYGAMGILLDPMAEKWEHRVKALSLDPISKHRYWNYDAVPMLAPHLHLFPPSDPPLLMSIWTEDNTFRIPNGDILELSRKMGRTGKVWREEDLLAAERAANGSLGWQHACPTTDHSYGETLATHDVEGEYTSFIANGEEYADHCVHPELLDLNGQFIMETQVPYRRLDPMFVNSKPFRGGEMLTSPTRDINDTVPHVPWNEKHDKRLFFRGGPTGMFHSDRWDWRSSQRDRAAFLGDPSSNEGNVSSVLTPSCGALEEGWTRRAYGTPELVKQYLDIGVVQNGVDWVCGRNGAGFLICSPNGEEIPGCQMDTKGCDEMLKELPWKEFVSTAEEYAKYKYRLDIDGYGWTSRWRRELSTGSVILKASVYPEWWSTQIIPWYHYIPVSYDYSDLFDIMSFFTGPPGLAGLRGHDHLAQEIGTQGREFAMTRLRWEDLQSYMFLLLLEYRRAWVDDRKAATFRL